MRVVAVDVGGTHVRFAEAEVAGGRVVALAGPITRRTADYHDLPAAWHAFAAGQGQPLPRAAAIAVACPVRGDPLTLTNNAWTIGRDTIGETLGLDVHVLINDFEAVGHAVAQVPHHDLAHVCGPAGPLPRHGVTTIVGPGTGLGVCQLWRDGDTYGVVASEGGHVGFAPRDPVDDAILADLRTQFGRVSVERVVSGPGLVAIHSVLARGAGHAVPVRDAAALWSAALAGEDSVAVDALERFCETLGAVAGDLALASGPTAVVIAGGLGLRLATRLGSSRFAHGFADKGRFQGLMRSVPVKLITHPQPGLYGAAAAFARMHAP